MKTCGMGRYSRTRGSELSALRSVHFTQKTSVPVWYEAGWAPEPVWTLCRRIKYLAPAGNRIPIRRLSIPYPSHCFQPKTVWILTDARHKIVFEKTHVLGEGPYTFQWSRWKCTDANLYCRPGCSHCLAPCVISRTGSVICKFRSMYTRAPCKSGRGVSAAVSHEAREVCKEFPQTCYCSV
jgi:hypothetical protein